MQEILKNIVIVTLKTTLWSGRKRLRPEDLKLVDGSELPPDKLASLGSKRVMDPAALAVFERLKRRAEREILAVGTRFLNGYAVPKEKLKELMTKLAAIEEEFEAAKRDFLSEYDQAVESWIAANSGWEEVIRRSIEDVAYVGRQLAFSTQTFTVSPHRSHRSGLESEVHGLAGQLRQEVTQMAHATWEASFEGKTVVGQRAVRPIRAMASKIEGLAFLEPALYELVTGIHTILGALPTAGPIKGADFASLCGALHLLGNIPEARQIAENLPVEVDPEEIAAAAESTCPAPSPIPNRPPLQPPVQWF